MKKRGWRRLISIRLISAGIEWAQFCEGMNSVQDSCGNAVFPKTCSIAGIQEHVLGVPPCYFRVLPKFRITNKIERFIFPRPPKKVCPITLPLTIFMIGSGLSGYRGAEENLCPYEGKK